MDAFAKFATEIAALNEDAVIRMKNWQQEDPAAKYHISVDLTTMLVFGEVSPAVYAVRLLERKRFDEDIELLYSPAGESLEDKAVRSRYRQSLQDEIKLLQNLFKMLVERELPEAAQYCGWEVHPSGQVFVRSDAIHKDTRFIEYFSGKTQATAVDL